MESPSDCSGRLNSFQLKSVREVLRDWYHIDGIYWPNTLHLDTVRLLYASVEMGKAEAAGSLLPLSRWI